MSKTEALKEASEAVGKVHRQSRTSYYFMAPYYETKPWGPTTECRADSYPKAVWMRTARVVGVALALMGKTDTDWSIERARNRGYGSAREILNACLEDSASSEVKS